MKTTCVRQLALAVLLACVSLAANAASRIVALGGDVTETLYAIHAEGNLVAVDSTSTWPVAATSLPQVGYVRQLSAEGVLALRPDLIVATHDAGPPTAMAQLREAGVRIASLPASRTPEDIVAKIRGVGALTGHAAEAEALARSVTRTFATLSAAVDAMPQHPRAVFLMSTGQGSPMAAGAETAADRALVLAGARNVATGIDGYKAVSPEALVAMAPDVIVLMQEREAAVGGIAGVLALPGVADTPAGKARRVYFVPGQALLGFGPRTAGEALALQRRLASLAP
ncbi:ABC transporter substrate-binding protein [Luteibacter sp. ME-Dv--P-043b]|uniref:heme/hemin ABC transporter substrate-binding protein n=1 Tax=Luteibacter sp. ME-Dv--P-043b TaxID=3040291 RepID=UPI002556665E|nr:ABC transporter substrate-binding protein [Luteibacter sp. ME-Dv--P-043b]